MATNTLGLNITFPIYNSDGSPFHNLVLTRSTMESSVMALDDKITGDVYYKDNSLSVTLTEYIEYKHDPSDSLEDPVRFILVSPPTIVREGMVSDNGDLHGMCKYSFVFYHPMCALSNIPFSDIAVTEQEGKYLSQSKTFYWIGTLSHFVDKLNANLAGTVWTVALNFTSNSDAEQWQKSQKLSDVLSFDQVFISDALKTAYDTWEIPFTISQIKRGTVQYSRGKRFLISFGKPNQTILDTNNQEFTFRFGQGVGLKNNSKTPRNNKIVTRIIGKGSENNIPYGYPQIRWYGQSGSGFTYGDHAGLYTNVTIGGKTFSKLFSYPIYKGIYGGQYVELIKHPFTRDFLMPTVYVQDLFNKVSPYAVRTMPNGTITVNQDYNPDNELRDYYDAGTGYVNQIDPTNPCVEIHQFEDIKPELDYTRTVSFISVEPITNDEVDVVTGDVISQNEYLSLIDWNIRHSSNVEAEQTQLRKIYQQVTANAVSYHDSGTGDFPYEISIDGNKKYFFIKYTSPNITLDNTILRDVELDSYTPDWDDTMRDDGTYVQSYFKVKIPQLDFDLYACASITEKMDINMRSGACIGCTFPVQIDWDDYKRNFYDANGDFDPVIGDGHPRDGEKYPDSSQGQITLILKKELDTFGILMPNIYQQPKGETSQGAGDGDVFVILGISLPSSYIDNAQTRLDSAMREYMLENNVHYYEYPLKFDEYFLATHTNILKQIQNNCRIKFQQSPNESPMVLFVKQIVIKYWESTLPQYDITLSDDIEIVLNSIGQVTDDVSRMRVELSEIQKYYSNDISQTSAQQHNIFLHKDRNDSTNYNLALRGNTTFGTRAFVPDSTGYGYYEDKTGERAAFLQVENLKVLGKMEAKEVEIQEVNYVGGSIVLTPANGIKAITSVEHDTTNNRYKLYYNTVDSEGNEVKNTWQVGDLAYSERWDIKTGSSGPLENHLWWRKVVAVGDGYITVSDVSGEKLAGSDVPEVGDKVVMLGNTSDTTRQNAIILSSSQQYAPYIRVYTGVHTFELPEYELQLKPGDNLLSGRVRFQDGTNGRIEEVLYKATYGKGNIVRNTAFRGDYLSRLIEDGEVVEADDTMFNPSLKYWTTSNATVQTDNLSASGVSCVLASGSMAQTLLYPLVAGEKYVVTFRAKGTSLKLNVGSETARTISLTNAYKAYTEVFTIGTASDAFSITNANCTICEIQMERGEIPSTWHVSPYDNNSDLAAIQDLQYLADAMKDYTDIDGGLVLTRQIRLGEHNVNGQVEDFTEHAGANGAYASDNSVAFWGGGTLEQAIRAVSAYVNNETYQPTAQELANMAKFVVTHGGRAILNDVILRGYIYALGGVFKGELEAATGTFKGFLRSLFEHASVVETQASANKYNLSGDHCNLIVDRGNEYVLPCADAHIGKRIVLVDAVENSDSNTYVTVSTANSTGIIGFLGDDVNKSTSANPSKLMFINGTMEFICTKVGNPAVIRWVLISNQTAWSKSSDSIFKDVDARPLLCYYGLLDIEAMTATASDTVGITEYYKRDGIRLNAMRVSMSNDDKGRCIVTVYFPVSTTWNQNAILTVMGMGYDNTSSHRATYATIETLSYGDDATLGAVINTANFSGFTNGKFFIKVEYLGE